MRGKVPPQLRSSILPAALQRSWIYPTHASNSRTFSTFQTQPRLDVSIPPPLSLLTGSLFSSPLILAVRNFSSNSAPPEGSQDAIILESAEAFDSSLQKVKEEGLPAIFYFSAAWCGPCKTLSPVVNQLSKMYPPCVTYKIDIDMDGIQSKLYNLEISAVPTLNFFNGGKQVATVVGADVKRIKEVMNEFFK